MRNEFHGFRYIKKAGTDQYIDHHYGNRDTCSLSTLWKTEFTIDRNSDGTISIHNGNWYLCNNGNGEWSNRDFRFQQNMSGQDRAKFRLCKASDAFDSFAARKVAAKDLSASDNFIIYRKFVDEKGNEQLYALASDGTFVRIFDGGDSVYWRETDKNIYWNYLPTGTYYSVFTDDPKTNQRVYINPMDSTHQTITTDVSYLTLIGKDNGEYGTAFENWDQTAYDYAGLHVTAENGTVSLSTGTRVAGTSDEFLFAVASQMPGAADETVATVDSNSLGIKITMFDYGDANREYSAGTKLDGMTNTVGTGSDAYTPHAAHELVTGYLTNGVPTSKTAGAMTGLFTTGGRQVTASKENVNHLFLQSYYDESGMFRYRSEDNYAYLPFSNGQITGTDFTVYRQAATPYTTDKQPGHTYYYHGHFMPFNDIDMTQHVGRLMNQYGNAYDPNTHEIIGEIPIGDGRTYEEIYGIQGIPNFYTGMKMEASFSQPRNGKLENGDDMIFKFTGDDDMWVYINGVLVLDIGGIHEPLSGTINFATGEVTNPTGSSLAGTTTLYRIFQNVLNASGTPQSVKDKISSITWKDVDGNGTPDTFADYTNHSFGAFYMERGAGASNLDIQFNLKVTLADEFTVEKKLPDGIDTRFVNEKYKFQATYLDGTDEERPLRAGINNVCSAVVYKGKTDTNGNPIPVSVDENGFFYLKPGEAAVFKMADESIRYNVKEVEIDNNLNEKVEINGTEATVTDGTAQAGYTYVSNRSHVLFQNYPFTQNLLITKHITADSAPMEQGENPVFEFRVYLESIVTNDNGTTLHRLVPYSYGPYYLIKEVEGENHYFTLTGDNNAPVDKGKNPVVCSTTGRSGSINSIPPEYTIVIPNLVVGTNFYVEERRDNIPEGYEFVKEELTNGTYNPTNLDTSSADAINRVLARDENDQQDFDPSTIGRIKTGVNAESHVYNRKPRETTNIKILKVDDKNETLAGAIFTLQKEEGSYQNIKSITNDDAEHTKKYSNVEGVDDNSQFTSSTTAVEITNLPDGDYKLVEESAPSGYVITLKEIEFKIENKKVTGTDVAGRVSFDGNTAQITIVNTPGTPLPMTGGSGTGIFTLIGGILSMTAGAILTLTSYRRRKKQYT